MSLKNNIVNVRYGPGLNYPIKYVYRGEFKNGYFHGKGQQLSFSYDYDAEPFHYKYPIDGVYVIDGEWERGWLFWDRESRVSGSLDMNV